MKIKIVALVLHIICTVVLGVNVVIATSTIARALYIAGSIAGGTCIGMDITSLIFND